MAHLLRASCQPQITSTKPAVQHRIFNVPSSYTQAVALVFGIVQIIQHCTGFIQCCLMAAVKLWVYLTKSPSITLWNPDNAEKISTELILVHSPNPHGRVQMKRLITKGHCIPAKNISMVVWTQADRLNLANFWQLGSGFRGIWPISGLAWTLSIQSIQPLTDLATMIPHCRQLCDYDTAVTALGMCVFLP